MVFSKPVEVMAMFRARDKQRDLFSGHNQFFGLLRENSFYRRLAESSERLFPDEKFRSLYRVENNGHPCIPPGQMFCLLLLQAHDRCSDYEAVERAQFDLRWLAVLDLKIGQRLCARSTLVEFRARLHLSGQMEELFTETIREAKRLGVIKSGKLTVAIDTTPVLGRGAVKDTYNLIADGIRNLVRVLAKAEKVKPETWAQEHDLNRYWAASSLKGEAEIDWSDEAQRRVFLNGLAGDVGRVLQTAKKCATVCGADVAQEIEAASKLLRRLLEQDTEPVPPPRPPTPSPDAAPETQTDDSAHAEEQPDVSAQSDAQADDSAHAEAQAHDSAHAQVQPDGSPQADEQLINHNLSADGAGEGPAPSADLVRIRQGVAHDRMPSVHDVEMRHGHKSSSNLFNGHKLSIVVDVQSRMILSLGVLPGNAPDNQDALALVQRAGHNTQQEIGKAIGDCAFGDGQTRLDFQVAGIKLSTKMPSHSDPYHKTKFVLDLTNQIVTCPAGFTTNDVAIRRHRDQNVQRFTFSAATCGVCPHREECIGSKNLSRGGRTVTTHPQEELLQQARDYQKSPEYRVDLRQRQVVEHRFARLVGFGIRQARYTGRLKTKHQMLTAALLANLEVLASFSYLTAIAIACSTVLIPVFAHLQGVLLALPRKKVLYNPTAPEMWGCRPAS